MSAMMTESMKSSARQERCRRYGFDCVDFLEWKGWDVGGEYKLTVSLKNVGKKMAAIKYKLPASKYFGMEFPMVAKVSPGMSYHVDVVFRPIHMEAYEDEILFSTSLGDFAIPIRAVLLSKSFFVAESFEFGFCPTMEMSEGVFEVRPAMHSDARWHRCEPRLLAVSWLHRRWLVLCADVCYFGVMYRS